mgnify:CR=1 FL=1
MPSILEEVQPHTVDCPLLLRLSLRLLLTRLIDRLLLKAPQLCLLLRLLLHLLLLQLSYVTGCRTKPALLRLMGRLLLLPTVDRRRTAGVLSAAEPAAAVLLGAHRPSAADQILRRRMSGNPVPVSKSGNYYLHG